MNDPQQPVGWTDDMDHFLKSLIPEDEEIESAKILFEAEYPEMADKVGSDWLGLVRSSVSYPIVVRKHSS